MEAALLHDHHQGSRNKQEEEEEEEESEREKKCPDDEIIITEINDDCKGVVHTSVWFFHSGNRFEEAQKKSNDDIVIDIDSIKDDSENAEKMCRICYESSESSEIIKLGCHCKGGIEFAHRICASKWFSHKGNIVCEVCGKNVDNNNVTLTLSWWRKRWVREIVKLFLFMYWLTVMYLMISDLIQG